MEGTSNSIPILPRRAFIAAGLAALTTGSSIALAILGGLDKPEARTFQFSRGVSLSGGDENQLRGFLSEALADSRIQVTILGHTGSTGNADANQKLSEDRAEMASNIAQDLGIDRERITARGLGGSAPLEKRDSENDRAHQTRLARVEIILQIGR